MIKKLKNKILRFEISLNPLCLSIKKQVKQDASWYYKDYKDFKRKLGNDGEWIVYDNYPCLSDRSVDNGPSRNPYMHQDLYVAKKIYNNNPIKHVDVGSRIDGFVTHVAVFREIEVLDIRKMDSNIPNMHYCQADLTDETSVPANYCDSISCLHALEHFGLGRYGDTIDPYGHIKGFNSITKILKKGGTFYFSVPMGIQRIEFNAHRIFGMTYLVNLISKDYDIVSFAYIDDNVEIHENVTLTQENIIESFGCNHGCAIFELKKK